MCSVRDSNAAWPEPLLIYLVHVSQEYRLLQCVERMGHKWKAIVEENFPGRTALSAKNQYTLMSRARRTKTSKLRPEPEKSSPGSSKASSQGCRTRASPASTELESQDTVSEGMGSDWDDEYTSEGVNYRGEELRHSESFGSTVPTSSGLQPYGYATHNMATQDFNLPMTGLNEQVQPATYPDPSLAYHNYGMASSSQIEVHSFDVSLTWWSV